MNWLEQSQDRFADLKRKFSGRTFLVLGNGPSLDTVTGSDVERFVTIACNNAWRMQERWKRDASMVLMTDRVRLSEFANENPSVASQLVIGDNKDIVPSPHRWSYYYERRSLCIRQLTLPFLRRNGWALPLIKIDSRLFEAGCDKQHVSFDYADGFNFGQSVVVSGIQLAVALGARRVLLCGVDAHVSKTAYFSQMPQNAATDKVFLSNPRMTMEPYLALLRAAMDPLGIDLIDCTPNGALRSLQKGLLSEYQA